MDRLVMEFMYHFLTDTDMSPNKKACLYRHRPRCSRTVWTDYGILVLFKSDVPFVVAQELRSPLR
jgi:hypothetical protein